MENILSKEVTEKFGVILAGDWIETPLTVVNQAWTDFCQAFHLLVPIHLRWTRNLEMRLHSMDFGGLTSKGLVLLNPRGLTTWTVVHELAHAWDFSAMGIFSLRLMLATHSWGPIPIFHRLQPTNRQLWYRVGNPPPPCGIDQNFNRLEDFAETVAAYVYPKIAFQRAVARGFPYGHYGYTHFRQTPRGMFMAALASSLQNEEKTFTS
ncbi:MAG: hypothetical protein AB9897_03540 [Anaerolineaceae bacterium]